MPSAPPRPRSQRRSPALFKTGFFGAFTRTYYPAPLIAAINTLWATTRCARTAHQAVAHRRRVEPPQLPRPRVCQGPECAARYIKAYDAALADVDVLVMPPGIMTAPRNQTREPLEAVEDNLMAMSREALATLSPSTTRDTRARCPVGKSSRVSRQHAARRAFLRRSAPHAGRLRLPARDRLEQDHRRSTPERGRNTPWRAE